MWGSSEEPSMPGAEGIGEEELTVKQRSKQSNITWALRGRAPALSKMRSWDGGF